MFRANIPEKIIHDVTGNRSNALMLYERPSIDQLKTVTSVLMKGKNIQQRQQPLPPCQPLQQTQNCVPLNSIGSLFSGCSGVNISNLVVNIQPCQQQQQPQSEVLDELECGDFDDIVDSLDL